MPSQPRRDPAALTSFLLFWILSSFQWIVHVNQWIIHQDSTFLSG
jgi:hypothetical protein